MLVAFSLNIHFSSSANVKLLFSANLLKGRSRGDFTLKTISVSKVLMTSSLSKHWALLQNHDLMVQTSSVQTFKPLIYKSGNFVYHHWKNDIKIDFWLT